MAPWGLKRFSWDSLVYSPDSDITRFGPQRSLIQGSLIQSSLTLRRVMDGPRCVQEGELAQDHSSNDFPVRQDLLVPLSTLALTSQETGLIVAIASQETKPAVQPESNVTGNSTVTIPSPATDRIPAVLEQIESTSELVDQAAALDAPSLVAPPELTIVIPVYNEPETVLQIVDRVRALPIRKQIIVVNDGSTDGTDKSVDSLIGTPDVEVIHHAINSGKGAALQTGFRLARGRFVIVQDADLEYDPIDIMKVIEPLVRGEADVVYGSRYLEQSKQDPSRLHRFGNWLLTTLSNLMTGYRLTDMETCYKAFRRELLQEIKIEQPRFGFEPEITAKLARRRARVSEVGVSYQSRGWDEGKKIGVKDLINTLYCIVRYAWF